MIKIFIGDDRVKAKQEILHFLGKGYEVFDGVDLLEDDLSNICFGNSLFAPERSVLIQDLSKNKRLFEKLPSYLETSHKIAILEQSLDKRSSIYKSFRDKKLIYEFTINRSADFNKVFNIFSVAKQNGPKAIEMLESIKDQQDPIMFFGLMVSGALKDFNSRQGTKERKVLDTLSQLDLQLKSNPIDPWLIIESFLIRLSQI